MSCMVQKHENTAAIADYIARLLNYSYEHNGMCAPELLGDTLDRLGCYNRGRYYSDGHFDAAAIYKALVGLNVAAFCGRYGDEYEVPAVTDYKSNDISSSVEWNNGQSGDNGYYSSGHYVIKPWHYQMYRHIEFYIYQCEEDATSNSKLLAGMLELLERLGVFILQNSDGYLAASYM